MEETIINKLKKIKALAEGGIEGEAINAKKLLDELIQKYNIKYEDIFDEETRKEYCFCYSSKEEKTLFFHCVANIFGSKSDIYKSGYHYLNGQMKLYLKLTSLEYALFNDFYEFHRKYWREYIKKQQHLLMRAYIDSQNIYDISPKDKNDIKTKFNINMDEIIAMLALSKQMKDIVPQYRKCLSK